MRDVIETRDGYRLSILPDDDPVSPDDDEGATPILKTRLHRAGDVEIEAFNEQAKPYVALLQELYYQEGSLTMALTRLRQRCGTVHYDSYGPNQGTDYKYIAFDTNEFREALELPTWLTTGENNTAADSLADVQAWVEGDVWGWEIERLRKFTKTYDDGEVAIGEEWTKVDYVYGYFSKADAINSGQEALTALASK